jgi:predicted RNase H-like HicB family nuclease
MKLKYAVIYERGPTSVGAYVPDLPGCVAVAETMQEVQKLIREAIQLHVGGMVEDGQPIPEPGTQCEYVDANVPAA